MGDLVLRKIRYGRVKIGGHWYRPSKKRIEYDGRLDGMVFAFGRYRNGGEYNTEFVSLWGPEQHYRESDTDKWEDDPQVVDGTLPWIWWDKEALDG